MRSAYNTEPLQTRGLQRRPSFSEGPCPWAYQVLETTPRDMPKSGEGVSKTELAGGASLQCVVPVKAPLPASFQVPPVEFQNRGECGKCGLVFHLGAWNRHHCRKCGMSVCASCAPNFLYLREFGYKLPVRHCNDCTSELTHHVQLVVKVQAMVRGFLKRKHKRECIRQGLQDLASSREREKNKQAAEWGHKEKCEKCQSSFSLLLRKHHCRKCGMTVCTQCAPDANLFAIPECGYPDPVRHCLDCSAMEVFPEAKADKPVQFSEKNTCEKCYSNFNVFWRKHHCRRCGMTVCAKCAPDDNLLPIPEAGFKRAVRHCLGCSAQALPQETETPWKEDMTMHAPHFNEWKACQKCNSSFSVFWRRHHCRKCGHSVCARCAPDQNLFVLPECGYSRAVRLCLQCSSSRSLSRELFTLPAEKFHNESKCEKCYSSFHPWCPRHHCRRCGSTVCASCAPDDNLLAIPECGYRHAVRHCLDCSSQVNQHSKQAVKVQALTRGYLQRQHQKKLVRKHLQGLFRPQHQKEGNSRSPDFHDFHSCEKCGASFNLLEHRHHCRRCGASVCASCAPDDNVFAIPEFGYPNPTRHCLDCSDALLKRGVRAPAKFRHASRCEKCDSGFFLLGSKHHCRRCGMTVCANCAPDENLLAIPEVGYNDPVRHCLECSMAATLEKGRNPTLDTDPDSLPSPTSGALVSTRPANGPDIPLLDLSQVYQTDVTTGTKKLSYNNDNHLDHISGDQEREPVDESKTASVEENSAQPDEKGGPPELMVVGVGIKPKDGPEGSGASIAGMLGVSGPPPKEAAPATGNDFWVAKRPA